MAATAQQIFAWPSDNIYEIGTDYPVGAEPDPELARVIRQCDEEIHALWTRLLMSFQKDMGLEISPRLQIFPALTERLTRTLVPLMSCDAGFEYADVHPDASLTGWVNVAQRVNEDMEEVSPNARSTQSLRRVDRVLLGRRQDLQDHRRGLSQALPGPAGPRPTSTCWKSGSRP